MTGLISVNGKISPPAEALVPALDRGLLFGDAVFETVVAYGGKILALHQHLERLRTSAQALDFEIPWSNAELAFELQSLAQQLDSPKSALRLTVSRGNGLGLKPAADAAPNRVIYCMPAPTADPLLYQDGIKLKRVLTGHTNRGPAAKTNNYLAGIMALKKAEKEAFDDILWTNADNEITEAATANIFFLARSGDLVEFVTPPPASGLLLGITRATLIELIRNAKIPVREHVVYADELPRFDEAFVCSTVRGLVAVSAIDRHKLHSARASSVFRHIERLYGTWIETQLGYRVDVATGRRLPATPA